MFRGGILHVRQRLQERMSSREQLHDRQIVI